MRTVNVHEAKTHFSQLLDAAMAGEEIIIAKAGTPCVRLVPILTAPRKPGALKGKGYVSDSFFEPLSDDEIGQWE
ncbi:MAG: type II toxin-antitoxin system Phd/YefM family antitoxin [Gammaproteobacteria bacterium]|nr:MAG: type II toxin-antitoxin system Phd/YefM family antitoxin [Gammaproteobacteria bacterium]